MLSSADTKCRPTTPHCSQCGFEMTPLRLGRRPGIEVLDRVYECRSCGVMTVPEPPAPATGTGATTGRHDSSAR